MNCDNSVIRIDETYAKIGKVKENMFSEEELPNTRVECMKKW